MIAEVFFQIPLDKGFDYRVPESLAGALRPGHRVAAPLGGTRTQVGVVTRVHDGPADVPLEKLKPLTGLLDPTPALTEESLALARWMAARTFCSRGEALFAVLPVGQRRPPKRNSAPRVLKESPAPYGAARPAGLTDDQKTVMAVLSPAAARGEFAPFLLHGVNAAGKTEVYLHLIEEVLARGQSAIFLVPEIGLTPQTEAHVTARFGAGVAVWHSALSAGERWKIWEDARAGKIRVALGPRSALFLPLPRLGLIVVDEEHDASYKNDSSPHYHARDTALEKARLHRCAAVLGSATPSMESLLAAREGRLRPLRMTRRVADRPFPTVTVVDMTKEKGWYMSDAVVNGLKDRLAKGEQSLLFLNRRGFATRMTCRACGWEARCPACRVSLVYHKTRDAAGAADLFTGPPVESLRCHACAHKQPVPRKCPDCAGEMIFPKGKGTQRVENDVRQLFPAARVLRWDRDTTQKKAGHERAFQSVRSDAVDVVIGTQMIAQGLDFPRVTLGGILDADRSLRFPDFRAGERTFQLLTQVAGRVGRGTTPGDVVLQTRHPDHYAVRAAKSFDFDAFAEEELAFRRELNYPPFVRLAAVILRGEDEAKTERAATALTDALQKENDGAGQVLGPAPAFHHHREGFSHWQILLKGGLERLVPFAKGYDLSAGVTLTVDVDPENIT